MMRGDEWRKRSSAKSVLSCDTSRAGYRSLVTCGLIRLAVPVLGDESPIPNSQMLGRVHSIAGTRRGFSLREEFS